MKDDNSKGSITDSTNKEKKDDIQSAVDKRVLLVGKLKGMKEAEKKKAVAKRKTSTKSKKSTVDAKKPVVDTKKATEDTKKSTVDTKKVAEDTKKSTVDTRKATADTKKISVSVTKSKESEAKAPVEKVRVAPKKDSAKVEKASKKSEKLVAQAVSKAPVKTVAQTVNKAPVKTVAQAMSKTQVKAEIKPAKKTIKTESAKTSQLKISIKTIKDITIVVLAIALIISLIYIGYIGEQNISNKMLYSSLSEEFDSNAERLIAEGATVTDNVKTLAEQNPDIKGWIKIEGTNINYPILQGLDNDYYLTHNYKNQQTSYGSIYMNVNSNIKDNNSNVIIYGHDMKDGQMFSDLVKYASEEYYKEHKVIKIMTDESENEYEIVSAFKSKVFYKDEKNVFRFYQNYNLENEDKYNDYVKNCKKLQLYNTGIEAKPGDQLITLITCEYSQENGRMVIVARKK